MHQTDESPSPQEVLASMLDFFAASADDQSRTVDDYYRVCQARRCAAHLHDPLVELTEALGEYADCCTTTERSAEAFFVGPLPKEVVLRMRELSKQAEAMLADQSKLFAVEYLGRSEWQGLRELARRGLEQWSHSRPRVRMSFYELMCQVVD